MRTLLVVASAFLLSCGGSSTPGATTPAATAPPPIPEHTHAANVEVPAAITAVIDATDRTAEDRALDAGRHPGETLAFFGIAPGQHVAEIFVGGGYTTELLARTVGADGHVWGENNRWLLQRFAEAPWAARLATPPMANVTRVDRELDAPLPPDAHDLDAVLCILTYHDTVWMQTDRAAMNRAIFDALKPGGVYGIIDHSAADGSGLRDVQTFHRIDEASVVAEVLAAGFRLDAEADFLRNAADTRDWNDSPREAGARRGTSDRFALRFVKP